MGSRRRCSKNGGLKEETLDYISQLPDALLVQILSLLSTKDAVASCVLSKRWTYLWTSVDNFLFVKSDFHSENFVSFVDHVLNHSISSKIKKFQLHLDYTSQLEINRWISFAVERKVEHLYLCSRDADFTYVLPLTLYANSTSLITLDLSHWVIDKGIVIAWNSLKSLNLDRTELDNDDIVNLLSGCPALETLNLSLFFGDFTRLEITSPNLKRLTLAGHVKPCDGNEEILEIIAPHIQHLEISGDLGHLKCRLVNVSSLVNASLTFEVTCITETRDEDDDDDDDDDEQEICPDYHQLSENFVLEYLQKLSHLTQLTIGSWLAEVVFMLEFEESLLPELRCKCLTLEMCVTKYNLYGVAGLLWTSPLLETLNIHLANGLTHFHCEYELGYFDERYSINLRSWISDIVFPNLKNVKIVGCTEKCLKKYWCEGGDKLFKLSKFLIKNAVALEKFVIIGTRRKCWNCSDSCVSRYLSELAEKLLGIPRSSKNLLITYEESALHD